LAFGFRRARMRGSRGMVLGRAFDMLYVHQSLLSFFILLIKKPNESRTLGPSALVVRAIV
jgi:hypothetical protein